MDVRPQDSVARHGERVYLKASAHVLTNVALGLGYSNHGEMGDLKASAMC
jgi:hypothetical protein